MALINRRS